MTEYNAVYFKRMTGGKLEQIRIAKDRHEAVYAALDAGETQTAIAARLGVSPARISLMKRLRPAKEARWKRLGLT